MGCLGVHFALPKDKVKKLKSFKNDSDRLEYLQEDIEEEYFEKYEEFTAQSDKAWDAMHRVLSEGDLDYTSGPYPLRLAVMGGEQIYAEDDYIMSLKTPQEVKDIAPALAVITKEEFRKKYDSIDPEAYGFPKNDEDFEYTWEWFKGIVAFYKKASEDNRWVLFTADQ